MDTAEQKKREYYRNYYEQHKDIFKSKARERYLKNRISLIESAKDRYQKNREELALKQKIWRIRKNIQNKNEELEHSTKLLQTMKLNFVN